jgi:hypothetical protein
MEDVIAFLIAHKIMIVSVLYVILNEVSAFVPSLRNNGVVKMVLDILKGLGASDPANK